MMQVFDSKDSALQYMKEQLPNYLTSECGVRDLSKNFLCLNPGHNEKNPSMSYNKQRNRVKCFSAECGVSWDIVDLIAARHGISQNDDASKFQEAYKVFDIKIESGGSNYEAKLPPVEVNKNSIYASSRWRKAEPATNDFAYLQRKQVPCYGLKMDVDGKMGRVLLVPAMNAEGRVVGIERIAEDGTKRHLGEKDSCPFFIGAPKKGEQIHVVEGYATGCTVFEITGKPVAVAFSIGNMTKAAQEIVSRFGAVPILCPDTNRESSKEVQAALRAGFDVVLTPAETPDGDDWNDIFASQGKAKAAELFKVQKLNGPEPAEVPEPVKEEPVKEKSPERLCSIDNLVLQKADFLIDGILESDSLAAIFGESGAGKSFLALDMMMSVATGIDFHGRATKKAPCIYVCAEGKRGLAKRNKAWNLQRWGKSDGVKEFYPVMASIELPDAASEKKLIELIDGAIEDFDINVPGIICFDTLARTLLGDENSNSDMSSFIRCMDRIKARYPGSTVLAVHHTGHAEKGRARGASALRGALDAEFMVEIDKNQLDCAVMTFSCTKAKDAEPFPKMFFEMKSTDVFYPEFGEPETSLYLAETKESPTARGGKSLSATEQLGLASYEEALRTKMEAPADSEAAKDKRKGVYLEDWRLSFYKSSTADKIDSKRKAFDRARASLVKNKLLNVENDMYTKPDVFQKVTEILRQKSFSETESVFLGQPDSLGQSPDNPNLSGKTSLIPDGQDMSLRTCPAVRKLSGENEENPDSDSEITEVTFKTAATIPVEDSSFTGGFEPAPAPSEYNEALAAALIKENPAAKKLFQEKFDRMFLTIKNGELCRAKCLERTWELYQAPTTAASRAAI